MWNRDNLSDSYSEVFYLSPLTSPKPVETNAEDEGGEEDCLMELVRWCDADIDNNTNGVYRSYNTDDSTIWSPHDEEHTLYPRETSSPDNSSQIQLERRQDKQEYDYDNCDKNDNKRNRQMDSLLQSFTSSMSDDEYDFRKDDRRYFNTSVDWSFTEGIVGNFLDHVQASTVVYTHASSIDTDTEDSQDLKPALEHPVLEGIRYYSETENADPYQTDLDKVSEPTSLDTATQLLLQLKEDALPNIEGPVSYSNTEPPTAPSLKPVFNPAKVTEFFNSSQKEAKLKPLGSGLIQPLTEIQATEEEKNRASPKERMDLDVAYGPITKDNFREFYRQTRAPPPTPMDDDPMETFIRGRTPEREDPPLSASQDRQNHTSQLRRDCGRNSPPPLVLPQPLIQPLAGMSSTVRQLMFQEDGSPSTEGKVPIDTSHENPENQKEVPIGENKADGLQYSRMQGTLFEEVRERSVRFLERFERDFKRDIERLVQLRDQTTTRIRAQLDNFLQQDSEDLKSLARRVKIQKDFYAQELADLFDDFEDDSMGVV